MKYPQYPKYKDSGVEWQGEVPEGWDAIISRRLCRLNPLKSEREMPPDLEVAFLPMEAVGEDGSITPQVKFYNAVCSGYTYFCDNDIIIAKITPCFENGKCALLHELINGIGFGSTEFHVVRPRSRIFSQFIFYVFNTDAFKNIGKSEMIGSAGQKRVPEQFIRNFSLPFPTLHEQQTIAAFLDHNCAKIDALIAEQEKLITLLREKRQAVISHAVTRGLNPDAPLKDSGVEWLGEVPEGWEIIRLKNISSLIQTGPFGSQLHSNDYIFDGTPVINPQNITECGIVHTESNTISSELASKLQRHTLKEGEIIFGRRGEMGRCAIVTQNEVGWICGTGSLKVRLVDSVYPFYILYYLRTKLVSNLLTLYSVGTTMDNLNTDILNQIPLPCPTYLEQQAIVAYLDAEIAKIETLIAESEKAVALLKERRSVLISAAVTGKIDVRNIPLEN